MRLRNVWKHILGMHRNADTDDGCCGRFRTRHVQTYARNEPFDSGKQGKERDNAVKRRIAVRLGRIVRIIECFYGRGFVYKCMFCAYSLKIQGYEYIIYKYL